VRLAGCGHRDCRLCLLRSCPAPSRLPPHFLRVQHLDVSVDAQALKVRALLCGSPRTITLPALNRTPKSFLDCFPSSFRAEGLLGSCDEILVQLYRRSPHHACILTERYVHQAPRALLDFRAPLIRVDPRSSRPAPSRLARRVRNRGESGPGVGPPYEVPGWQESTSLR